MAIGNKIRQNESQNYEQKFQFRLFSDIVVEQNAYRDMEQNADYEAHHRLFEITGRCQHKMVGQRAEGRHHCEKKQQKVRLESRIFVVNKQCYKH